MALRAFVNELNRLEEEAPAHSGGRRARLPRARTHTESPAPREALRHRGLQQVVEERLQAQARPRSGER